MERETGTYQWILDRLPYAAPFLFVDALSEVHADGAKGSFTFRKELDFYTGHFKGNPVTPGVLLTECCAQIGLVCLGIYLLGEPGKAHGLAMGMSSAQIDFLLPVLPGEKVSVVSEKQYFRFEKLKCKVKMRNQRGELVCTGVLAGMIKMDADG
ncbi:3-hydroxyacyl-ACP dehydratase FabZ family protein [Maribacter sp. 2307ULW6-5]|uniref:3-hydroxyacyl-ACP dehydratase FabZ family protein n=1 Tax=Maribacter sp. 2307ULW6-5 TaxID=3386275 RepID=UPI0039BD6D94